MGSKAVAHTVPVRALTVFSTLFVSYASDKRTGGEAGRRPVRVVQTFAWCALPRFSTPSVFSRGGCRPYDTVRGIVITPATGLSLVWSQLVGRLHDTPVAHTVPASSPPLALQLTTQTYVPGAWLGIVPPTDECPAKIPRPPPLRHLACRVTNCAGNMAEIASAEPYLANDDSKDIGDNKLEVVRLEGLPAGA